MSCLFICFVLVLTFCAIRTHIHVHTPPPTYKTAGAKFDFDGREGAAYSLFSAPQFHVTMRIAGDGPKPHFMTEVGVLFRNESFLFTVFTMKTAFRDDLQAKLHRVGGRLLAFRPWEVTLGLCAGQRVTVRQMHTTEAERELWHADGRPFYYLDVEVAVPGCHDAYGGVLGQTYQCKYVRDGESFVWSHEQEEAFGLPGGLFSPSGAFAVDAPCVGKTGTGGTAEVTSTFNKKRTRKSRKDAFKLGKQWKADGKHEEKEEGGLVGSSSAA
jgi:hypothetical protein